MIALLRFELMRIAKTAWLWSLLLVLVFATGVGRAPSGFTARGANHLDRDTYQWQQMDLNQEIRRTADDPALAEEHAQAQSDIMLLGDVLRKADLPDKGPFIEAALEWEKRAGDRPAPEDSLNALVGVESPIYQQSRHALLQYLSDNAIGVVYRDVGEEPAISRAASGILGIGTVRMLLIPLIVVAGMFVGDRGSDARTLGNLTPLSTSRIVAARYLAGLLVLAVSALTQIGALAIEAGVKNGLGSFDYPMVVLSWPPDIQPSAIPTDRFLVLAALQILAAFTFFFAFSFIASRFTNRKGGIVGAFAVMLFVETFLPWITSVRTPATAILMPYTHVEINSVLGVPGTLQGHFAYSYPWAVAVLLGWAVVLGALALIDVGRRRWL